MKGFDYRDRSADNIGTDKSVAKWRELMQAAIAEGGTRRVVNGETFVKDAQGELLFEVYGNVS